jgi:hypothetical protein
MRHCELMSIPPAQLQNALKDRTRWRRLAASARRLSAADLRVLNRILPSRICVECLAQDGFVRAAWELPMSLRCPSHGTLLIDCCPQCETSITNARRAVRRCDCGYCFSSAKSIAAEPWLGHFEEIFTPWRTAADLCDPGIPALELASLDVLRVILRAHPLLRSGTKPPERTGRLRRLVNDHLPALQGLFEDGVEATHRRLVATLASGSQSRRIKTRRAFRQSGLPVLVQLATEFDWLVARQEVVPSDPVPPAPEYATLRELCWYTGLGRGAARCFITSGRVRNVQFVPHRNPGKTSFRIPLDEVKTWRAIFSIFFGSFSLEEVSEHIRCRPRQLRILIEIGVIPAIAVSSQMYRIRADDLALFGSRLEARVVPPPDRPRVLVPLGEVPERDTHGGFSADFKSLWMGIVARRVPLHLKRRGPLDWSNLAVAFESLPPSLQKRWRKLYVIDELDALCS